MVYLLPLIKPKKKCQVASYLWHMVFKCLRSVGCHVLPQFGKPLFGNLITSFHSLAVTNHQYTPVYDQPSFTIIISAMPCANAGVRHCQTSTWIHTLAEKCMLHCGKLGQAVVTIAASCGKLWQAGEGCGSCGKLGHYRHKLRCVHEHGHRWTLKLTCLLRPLLYFFEDCKFA